MVVWFTALSYWTQSAIAGIAMLPVTALATPIALKFLDNIIERYSKPSLKISLTLVVVSVYGIFILVPVFLQLLLEPDFEQSEYVRRLVDPWSTIWIIISFSPVIIYSRIFPFKVEKSKRKYFYASVELMELSVIFLMFIPLIFLPSTLVRPIVEADIAQMRGVSLFAPWLVSIIFFIMGMFYAGNWDPQLTPDKIRSRFFARYLRTRYKLIALFVYAGCISLYYI